MNKVDGLPPDTRTFSVTGEVSPHIKSCVAVAAPGAWVVEHEAEDFHPRQNVGQQVYLLVDRQHNAGERAFYQRTVQRLETLQAVQNLSQWSLDFDPATQNVVIHSVAVRRDGVAREHAEMEHFRFLRREQQMERLVIDGWWTLVLLLEDVRVGDVLDISFTITTQPRLLAERYSILELLPSFLPVGRLRFSLLFPAGGNGMRWLAADPEFKPEIRSIGEDERWEWALDHIEADEFEPSTPPWHEGSKFIHVSDCASWREVASALAEAWKTDAPQPELAAFAKPLFEAAADQSEAVTKAIQFVQDEIRYLSVNEDLGGQIPSAPDAVLRRRFGDCKDKALLLARLLREAGVEARPVLANTFLRGGVAQLLPSPNVFNHAIVEFTLDGQTRWVDPTVMLQGGGALNRPPLDLEMGLPVAAEAEALVKIDHSPRANTYTLREVFYLDTAGGQTLLEVQCVATGIHADNFRRSLALEGKDAFSKSREQFYRNMFNDASRVDTLQWDDRREGNSLSISERFDLGKQPYTKDLNARLCHLNYGSHVLQSILGIPGGVKTRKYPLSLAALASIKHTIEFHTPTMHDRPLTRAHKSSGAFEFDYELRKIWGKWTWSYSLDITRSTVEAANFEAHRKDLLELWPNTTIQLNLPVGVPRSEEPTALAGRRARRLPAVPTPPEGWQSTLRRRESRSSRRSSGGGNTLGSIITVVGTLFAILLIWIFFLFGTAPK